MCYFHFFDIFPPSALLIEQSLYYSYAKEELIMANNVRNAIQHSTEMHYPKERLYCKW